MKIILVLLTMIFPCLLINAYGEDIPGWIKNTAGWWADDKITQIEFLNAIEFLVNNGIISIDYECKFDNDEYSHIKDLQKRVLCDNVDLKFLKETVEPETTREQILIESEFNTDGFRSHEILKKDDDTYRIFLIGGSTIFGAGVHDEHTISSYLQKKYDDDKFEINVEVINAGIGASWSKPEQKLVKEKLVNYEPDLFIIYDDYVMQKI